MGGNSISPDLKKLNTLWSIGVPKTGKEVQSLLGLLNYMRDYIPRFAHIAEPLERLRNINGSITHLWTDKHDESFNILKKVLAENMTLKMPDFTKKFHLATDASNYGIGGILFQHQGEEKVIVAVVSKALNRSQRNYPVTKKELYAAVFCITYFKNWLLGSRFTLYTDHQALLSLFIKRQESVVLNNWIHCILHFDFDVVYVPGIKHVIPDALSRLVHVEWDEEWPKSNSKQLTVVEKNDRKDLFVDKQVENLLVEANESSKPFIGRSHAWDRPNFPQEKLDKFIKERFNKKGIDEEKRNEFILGIHKAVGHCTMNELFDEIWDRGYFYPNLLKDCRHVVENCLDCARVNMKHNCYRPLRTFDSLVPFQKIAFDWLYMPGDSGYKRVLVIKDICTAMILIKKMKKYTAKDLAKKLFSVFSILGIPQVIKSDSEPMYAATLMKKFIKLVGAVHLLGTPYHQNSNAAEPAIKEIQNQLRNMVPSGDLKNWIHYLPLVQMVINNKIFRSHGSKPFELFFNRNFDASGLKKIGEIEEKITGEKWKAFSYPIMNLLFPLVNKKVSKYRKMYKDYSDNKRKLAADVNVGTVVMIRNHSRENKWDSKWIGPFKIINRNIFGSYIVETLDGLPHSTKIHPNDIKVIKFTSTRNSETPIELEKIISHRKTTKGVEFKVKWKDYSSRYNSWISEENFVDHEMLQEYCKSNKVTLD